MTISILGKQDLIALPHLKPDTSIFGYRTSYTRFSYDACYSKYGFAVPLTIGGIPYAAIMDDEVPHPPSHLKQPGGGFAYLLIDNNANMWNVTVLKDSKGEMAFDSSYIDYKMSDGWWVTEDFSFDDLDHLRDRNILTGFLYTDPTKEKVDAFFHTQRSFSKLEWLSIQDIVDQINRRTEDGFIEAANRILNKNDYASVDSTMVKKAMKDLADGRKA